MSAIRSTDAARRVALSCQALNSGSQVCRILFWVGYGDTPHLRRSIEPSTRTTNPDQSTENWSSKGSRNGLRFVSGVIRNQSLLCWSADRTVNGVADMAGLPGTDAQDGIGSESAAVGSALSSTSQSGGPTVALGARGGANQR